MKTALCMTFRDYFDRVFIINLRERIDRRAAMSAELARVGLTPAPGQVEFFPAIKTSEAAGFINAGYHGCFRSHLEIYKLARDIGAQHLLVLEDDAELSPRFDRDQASIIEQLQSQPWGVAMLGYAFPHHGVAKSSGAMSSNGRTRLIPFPGEVTGSHFYAVHHTVLERLIDAFEGMLRRPPGHPDGGPMSPDGAINFFLARNSDVPAFAASPSLGGQRSSPSDIMPRWFDRLPGVRQTVRVLRQARRSFIGR